MLTKTIKYTDPITDEEVEKTLYFNLTKAEMIELDTYYQEGHGGFDGLMKKFKQGNDTLSPKTIMEVFKKLISLSYGERRDGEFIKTEERSQIFLASEAYSEVFMGLVQGDDDPNAFIQGILPKINGKPVEVADIRDPRAASEANMQGHQSRRETIQQERASSAPTIDKQD